MKKILFIEAHSVKQKIYNLLLRKAGPLSITDIHKRIRSHTGKKYNYRSIWQHIKGLELLNVVSLKKEINSTGQPVMVRLIVE